jgi:hypothetical protein
MLAGGADLAEIVEDFPISTSTSTAYMPFASARLDYPYLFSGINY